MSSLARKRGSSIQKLTPEYRREIAKKAINARRAKAKKKARLKEQPTEP
jgi:hypothetical protein